MSEKNHKMQFSRVSVELRQNEYGLITGYITLETSGAENKYSIPVRHVPGRLWPSFETHRKDANDDYPDIEYSLALGKASLALNTFMINDMRETARQEDYMRGDL